MNKRIVLIILVLLLQIGTIKELSGMEPKIVMQPDYLENQLQAHTQNIQELAERRDKLISGFRFLEIPEQRNSILKDLTKLFIRIDNRECDIEKIKQLQQALQLAQENNSSPFDRKWFELDFYGKVKDEDVDPEKKANEFTYTVSQMPSLSQRRNKQDQTNLCGYYCIFNAESLANNHSEQIMNREAFLQEFAYMLASIAQYRGLTITSPLNAYQNLSDTEILMLLKQKELADKVLLLSRNTMDFLTNRTEESLNTLMALDFDSYALLHQQILFEQFKNNKMRELVIINFTRIGGHYIAVLVTRPDPTQPDLLHFTIYDSLGTNYVDSDSDIRQAVIQPPYDFLTEVIPAIQILSKPSFIR